MKDSQITQVDDDDDSDIEEIECVAVVTKESNFLTDVLMEFFCNLLENHDVSLCLLLSQRNSQRCCIRNLPEVKSHPIFSWIECD